MPTRPRSIDSPPSAPRVRPAGLRARTRLMSGLPAFLATLMVGALAASPAAATFGTPFDVSKAGQDAGDRSVAVEADGDAVIAWSRFDGTHWRVQARARSAAGVLGPVQTLSSGGRNAVLPKVGVDADGDAVIAWLRFDGANERLQARTRSAAGVLGPVQTVSPAGQDANLPQVAVEADGDAVFAWSQSDGTNNRILVRSRSAAGVLSSTEPLSAAGQDAFDAQVGVDADGDAVVTWTRFDGANWRAQARTRSQGGALGMVQDLSAAGQNAFHPQVAVDADGDAAFAWERFDGANWRAQARARSAAGVLSAVQNLSDNGRDAERPEVDVDANGDAVFSWRRFDGANWRAQARGRSAAGVFGPVQGLSAAGRDAGVPHLAVESDGDAVLAWSRSDGTNDRLQARVRTAAGTLGAVQTLSAAGQNADGPRVAIDGDGDATVIWGRSDGANIRIQAAVGP